MSTLVDQWRTMRAAVADAGLSRADLAVLMVIMDRMNQEGFAWPSLSTIAADAKLDRSNVARSLRALVARSYLERESGTRVKSNRYSLGRAGRCASDTTGRCADDNTGGVTSAPGVVSPTHLEVVSPAHLELALKATYSNEPTTPPRGRALDDLFDEFWKAYPRKEAKGAARKAFAKHKPDRALLDGMIAALDAHQQTAQWQREGGKFVPHPATWLNREQWLDQIPVDRGAGESLADRAAQMHDEQRWGAFGTNVIEGQFSATSGRLPRESEADSDAINKASLQRWGIEP